MLSSLTRALLVPFLGFPLLPPPTSCHLSPFSVILRTGKGHQGGTLSTLTSCVAQAEYLHLSEPLEASVISSSPTCQFPTLGWGPLAPKLETYPLIFQALPLDAPPRGDVILEPHLATSKEGPPRFSLHWPRARSPSHPTECSGRSQALCTELYVPCQGGISASQPWALSLLLILYKLLPF